MRTLADARTAFDQVVRLPSAKARITGDQNSYTLTKRYRHKQGHWVWAQLGRVPLIDTAGGMISGDLGLIRPGHVVY